jgi:putative transposase
VRQCELAGTNRSTFYVLSPAVDGLELYQGLKEWFTDYNKDRRYTALNDEFPETMYVLHKQKAPEAA